MADKKPINPKLSLMLHSQFLGFCQERGQTQSDVVEAALLAWMHPQPGGDGVQMVLEKLREQEGVLVRMIQLLETLVKQGEAKPAPPPPPPVASHAALYPELRDGCPAPAFQGASPPARLIVGQEAPTPVAPAIPVIVKPSRRWRFWG